MQVLPSTPNANRLADLQAHVSEKAYAEILRWLEDDSRAQFHEEIETLITERQWGELEDAFGGFLAFGTGGIRGMMGAGTARMNSYTIRLASQAYSQYLLRHKPEEAARGVAIAYDSRHHSKEFMQTTASTLVSNGIRVYTFDSCRATPELSFTVRHLHLGGGIVITASHNPPVYNGYKVYNEKGCQELPDAGLLIEAEFLNVRLQPNVPFEKAVAEGQVVLLGEEVDRAFAETARKVSVYPENNVKIVYSPLHGVGMQSVLPVLKAIGFEDICLVESQVSLDGDFPNVAAHFPNPEFPEVYTESIALAKEVAADIVIVSDPDADRLGMAVPQKDGNWRSLSGNEGAALLGYFYLHTLRETGKLAPHPVVITTSVTSKIVSDVAASYGAEVINDLLVGFKFICNVQENLPPEKSFIFGCEESVGFLFSNDYRDKGADSAAVVAAEMACWCKNNGTSPLALLDSIYEKFGFYAERNRPIEIVDSGALSLMQRAMTIFRKKLPTAVAGIPVVAELDRLTGEVTASGKLVEVRPWDKGDMVTLFFSADEKTAMNIRPSGTEPKLKIYTSVYGMPATNGLPAVVAACESKALRMEEAMVEFFEKCLAEARAERGI